MSKNNSVRPINKLQRDGFLAAVGAGFYSYALAYAGVQCVVLGIEDRERLERLAALGGALYGIREMMGNESVDCRPLAACFRAAGMGGQDNLAAHLESDRDGCLCKLWDATAEAANDLLTALRASAPVSRPPTCEVA